MDCTWDQFTDFLFIYLFGAFGHLKAQTFKFCSILSVELSFIPINL